MRTLSPATSAKLFAAGFTIGPAVDSLHNQCLLKYDIFPIALQSTNQWGGDYPYFFCSSWVVPPLLGIAYVVLGGMLPRIFEVALTVTASQSPFSVGKQNSLEGTSSLSTASAPTVSALRNRALLAVATTAMIVKLSEYLEVHPFCTDPLFSNVSIDRPTAHLVVMVCAALCQWFILDRSPVALIAATITALGGPLSELPFVANGFWEYLDGAADYLPLQSIPAGNSALEGLLGKDYPSLALSSITGPCYFAVATDAIALGRWFDSDRSLSLDPVSTT